MLTNENYFSEEMEHKYCGASQYKMAFGSLGKQGCEYRYMQYLDGKVKSEPTKSMLIGSYVDAMYEGSIDMFRIEHPDLFVSRGERKGQLKSEFLKAEEIYNRCERDNLFHQFMSGEKQRIFTGEIDDLPFKIKIDSLHPGKCIVDLKVVKSITDVFFVRDLGYVDFISYWGYDTQLAIYQEIYRQNTGYRLPCYIAAADKGNVTNIEIIYVDDERLNEALENVKKNIPTMIRLRNKEIDPVKCGVCDECLKTKVLTQPIHFSKLIQEV